MHNNFVLRKDVMRYQKIGANFIAYFHFKFSLGNFVMPATATKEAVCSPLLCTKQINLWNNQSFESFAQIVYELLQLVLVAKRHLKRPLSS